MNRDLTDTLQAQREAAGPAPFPTLAVRRERLARLARMTKRHQHDIVRAIQLDFGQRSEIEIHLAEILPRPSCRSLCAPPPVALDAPSSRTRSAAALASARPSRSSAAGRRGG